jgi:hypothetical protein
MDTTTLAHIGIALLNLATALVSWWSGRRAERARWRAQDRRDRPR